MVVKLQTLSRDFYVSNNFFPQISASILTSYARNDQKCPRFIQKKISCNSENSDFRSKNDPKLTQKYPESG